VLPLYPLRFSHPIAKTCRLWLPLERLSAFAGPSTFAGPTVDRTADRLPPNFSVASVSSCSTLGCYSEELRIFGKIFSLRALRLCAPRQPGGFEKGIVP